MSNWYNADNTPPPDYLRAHPEEYMGARYLGIRLQHPELFPWWRVMLDNLIVKMLGDKE